jgi:hypothetical protein
MTKREIERIRWQIEVSSKDHTFHKAIVELLNRFEDSDTISVSRLLEIHKNIYGYTID